LFNLHQLEALGEAGSRANGLSILKPRSNVLKLALADCHEPIRAFRKRSMPLLVKSDVSVNGRDAEPDDRRITVECG
jgi:hypothetical protein